MKAPAEERGRGIACISMRKDVDSSEEPVPLENRDTVKINDVNIDPDNSPTARGEFLQSLMPKKPDDKDARKISAHDMGVTVARGFLVLNAMSAAKKEKAKAPKSENTTDIAESFNISAIESAEVVRLKALRDAEDLLLFI